MSNSAGRGFKMPRVSPGLIALVVVGLVAVSGVATSFFVVDASETGVVLRLGRFDREVPAGLNWKLPFGIEESIVVPTQQVQTMEFGYRTASAGQVNTYRDGNFQDESRMLTGDLNIADVEWEVQFRITDPRSWLFGFEFPEQTFRDISQSVMNRLIGDRAILDVLGSARAAIEVEAQQEMDRYFQELGLGVTVITVKTQDILPPAGPVSAAFQDVNAAIQDMNRYINEGQQAINREIPRAEGEADQIVEVARGYAAERVNRAQGDVARFLAVLAEYNRNPGVMRTRLYYEAMEDVLKNTDALTIIDTDLENLIPVLGSGGLQ